MTLSIVDLIRLQEERTQIAPDFFDDPPATPDNLQVEGRKFGFKIQWSTVLGVDGYRVAVMDDNNLETPKVIMTVPGDKSTETDYLVSDVAVTRQFSVQTFKADLSSAWYLPLAEATSKIEGGASDSAPAEAPVLLPPSDDETNVGTGGGGGRTLERNLR